MIMIPSKKMLKAGMRLENRGESAREKRKEGSVKLSQVPCSERWSTSKNEAADSIWTVERQWVESGEDDGSEERDGADKKDTDSAVQTRRRSRHEQVAERERSSKEDVHQKRHDPSWYGPLKNENHERHDWERRGSISFENASFQIRFRR